MTLSLIDQFAEHLSEHGDIRRAAVDVGFAPDVALYGGKGLFDVICQNLGPQAYDRRPCPTIAHIQAEVAEHFGTPVFEMTSARRSRKVARPRQIAMYLSKELTPKSLPQIGRFFGGRDHTTVIHAIHVVEAMIAADTAFAADINELRGHFMPPPDRTLGGVSPEII